MKKLILLAFIIMPLAGFSQANLMYINSPDSFEIRDISTSDVIIKFDTANYATYPDGTTAKQVNDRLSDTITLNTAMQNVDSVNVGDLLIMPLFSSDPDGYTGRVYYNTTSNQIRYYNGSTWITL